MVFVKVRETYDLHTVKNKMTVIAVHTPKPDIIKRNYPGLLMQCRAYRPYSCDVRIASASVQPLDPLGVGTAEGDVAPEDVFNPILYKAMSNLGMSQLEARIHALAGADVEGSSANVDVDTVSSSADEFNLYYGLLSDTNAWRHASPQQGLEMSGLRPLVYEMVYNVGDNVTSTVNSGSFGLPNSTGVGTTTDAYGIRGGSKPMPFINCTVYDSSENDVGTLAGFPAGIGVYNSERTVPYLPVVCAAIIIPPSRLHSLYFRMVIEWTLEFTQIRSVGEITNFPGGLEWIGANSHYQNYSYEATKKAVTGSDDTILEKDCSMASSNVDINKVM